jgi:archaellum component FlaG (FlaF/FlaG flagellin family)
MTMKSAVRKKNVKGGFTLLELIITVVIVVLILAVVVAALVVGAIYVVKGYDERSQLLPTSAGTTIAAIHSSIDEEPPDSIGNDEPTGTVL